MENCAVDRRLVICFACLVVFNPALSHCAENRWTGRCEKVIDGDTIVVKRERSSVEVNLAGIDCPEIGQEFGREAKEATIQFLRGKIVTVTPVQSSEEGVTGRVEVYGKDASLLIIQKGWAWYYPRAPRDQRLAAAEDHARDSRRGMWLNPDPIFPWIWRKGNQPIVVR